MKNLPYSIPSTRALVAFESAARHCNFSRAAEELNTSQSAISRHIAELERRLGVRLFARRGKRLSLTEQGEHYRRAVVSGLDNIQSAAAAMAALAPDDRVVIACSHEISHLYLMPRYEDLRSAVGEDTRIRIMTYEYDVLEEAPDPRIDLMFSYGAPGSGDRDGTMVFPEAVTPICSPAFAHLNKGSLNRPPSDWQALPLLLLTKENRGWATWEDWFESRGEAMPESPLIHFDNYVYLLEAATAGRGLALGWRGLIERHLENGALIPVRDDYATFDRALHAVLTPAGRQKPAARRCLAFFGRPET